MNNTTIPGPNPRANRFDDLMRRVTLAKSDFVTHHALESPIGLIISKDLMDQSIDDFDHSDSLFTCDLKVNIQTENVTEIQGLPVGILHGINDVVMVI